MIPVKTVSTSANGNIIISTNGIKNFQNSFKIIKTAPSHQLSHFYDRCSSYQSSDTHVSRLFPNLSLACARNHKRIGTVIHRVHLQRGANENEKKTRLNTLLLKKKNKKIRKK